MFRKFGKVIFGTLFICFLIAMNMHVEAAGSNATLGWYLDKDGKPHHISYDTTTGIFKSVGQYASGTATIMKYLDVNGVKQNAYCIQLSRPIDNGACGTKFKEVTSTSGKFNALNRITAGYARQLAYNKWDDKYKAYLYTVELANAAFGLSGSKNYLGKNDALSKVYEQAVANARAASLDSTLPAITLEAPDGQFMNNNNQASPNTYVSGYLLLRGLVASYGGGVGAGTDGVTTYTISASASSGTAEICSATSGCQQSITLPSGVAGDYGFVVKLSNGGPSQTVTVSVSGSNRSKYPSVTIYESAKDPSNCQDVITAGASLEYPRSVSTSVLLYTPGQSAHSVAAYKVDEGGNGLAGAEFKLYRALKDDATNTMQDGVLATSNGEISVSAEIRDDNPDDFFQYKYCIEETKSPAGYVLKERVTCIPVEKNDSGDPKCISKSGAEIDVKYCTAKFKCDAEGVEPTSEGKCPTTVPGGDVVTTYTCPSITGGEPTTVSSTDTCEYSKDPEMVDNPETGASEPTCTDEGATYDSTDGKCHISKRPDESLSCGGREGERIVDGACVKNGDKPAKCMNSDNTELSDTKYCTADKSDNMLVTRNGNNFVIAKINKRTNVTISKKAATGDDEVPGAVLRICSSKPDKDGKCTPVTLQQKGLSCPTVVAGEGENSTSNAIANCTYDSGSNTRTIAVEWTSGFSPKEWNGLPAGTYYLVEVLPPSGYGIVSTSTEFTIGEDGSIKTGGQTSSTGTVILKNKLNEMTISKADIATSKEVPGAVITICDASKDESGKWNVVVSDNGVDCSAAVLADGTSATWTSGDKPHNIKGLPAGTYYLVETIAPNGYSTAESILFTVNPDGSLVDKDGKSLKDSKITMYDKPLKDVKTGSLGFYIVLMIVMLSAVGGVGSYIFLKKNTVK